VIFAALYLLWAYQRVFHGPVEGENAEMPDMTRWELLYMAPLLAGILFLGIYPKPVLERIEPAVDHLVAHLEEHTDFREPDVAHEPPTAGGEGSEGSEGGEHG
ncbi:MAG TPA: Fe-S-binding domain-containing protein, partial [Acidimicrobiales bacterium]|nr:Fe-S-binding domain-containing protein [Acidimicrobiales bacterium]